MAAQDVIDDAKSRLEAMIAPINGGVGDDASFDDTFEAIKQEIEKLQSLSGGKPDWAMIANNSDTLLSEKTKDFRLALYYAAARSQTDGLKGVVDGLVLINELDAAFWEPMYPALKRPKQRGNLCQWFSDLAATSFTSFQPSGADRDLVKAFEQLVREADGFLSEKLGDAYSGLAALRSLTRNLVASLPAEAPPPAARAEAPAGGAQPQAAAPQQQYQPPPPMPSGPSVSAPNAGSISSVDSALHLAGECGLSLMTIARYLREQDAGSAVAYRLGRTANWITVSEPPDERDGRTFVPPPPLAVVGDWDRMLAAGQFVALFNSIEDTALDNLFWLDSHRYLANAMDKAGGMFAAARRVVVAELLSFLRRVPTLPNCSFSDGTPFADGQTKMWLEAEMGASGASAGGSSSGGGGGGSAALETALGEAKTLVVSGQLADGVVLLNKTVASLASPLDRFHGRLAVARLCLQAEQFAVARAQLEGLDQLVEKHRLVEWDPALCADLYGALYAAYKGLNRGEDVTPEARAREAQAFDRLCQLDAATALKLSTGPT